MFLKPCQRHNGLTVRVITVESLRRPVIQEEQARGRNAGFEGKQEILREVPTAIELEETMGRVRRHRIDECITPLGGESQDLAPIDMTRPLDVHVADVRVVQHIPDIGRRPGHQCFRPQPMDAGRALRDPSFKLSGL